MLAKEAQACHITDCHVGNPCELSSDPIDKIELPMIDSRITLSGEIYFVKCIINPEEDDVKPGVILGRSFLRMTKAITDFEAGTITIYPDIDPFLEETKEEKRSMMIGTICLNLT
ncbi:hypothetical protein Tco_1517515 [Tanacetum coccineum]